MIGGLETTQQVVRRIERLADTLGPDGFEIVLPQLEDLWPSEADLALPGAAD